MAPWKSLPYLLCSGALVHGACSDDAGADCAPYASDCAPLYQPEFSEIHRRTLLPSCAQSGAACHSTEGARAGIVFEDEDVSYNHLVGEGRVIPGDAECSLLAIRLHGGGGGFMPPGAPLSDAERCTLQTWMANGAAR